MSDDQARGGVQTAQTGQTGQTAQTGAAATARAAEKWAVSPALRRWIALWVALAPLLLIAEGLPSALVNGIAIPTAIVAGALALGRGPRWLLPLGTSLGVGALALVAGDLALRAVYVELSSSLGATRLLRPIPEQPELRSFGSRVDVSLQRLGDLQALRSTREGRSYRTVRVISDELGFRNSPGAPQAEHDAVLLGDSFAAGTALTQDEIWSSQLSTTHGIHTYTLAYPSNPWEQLMLFKRYGEQLAFTPGSGALIWAIFPPNDFLGPYGDLELPPPRGSWSQARTRIDTFRRRSPLRITARVLGARGEDDERIRVGRLADGREVLFYQNYLDALRLTPEALDARHPQSARVADVISEMQRLTRERGIELLVLLLPEKFEVYPELLPEEPPLAGPSAFARRVLEASAAAGIEVLDLLPEFLAAKLPEPEPDDLLYLPDDTHWSARGTAIAADAVARWWRERSGRTLVETP